MNYHYVLVKSICCGEGCENCVTYGVMLENNKSICIKDISTDKRSVEKFIEKLNKFRLSPIHLEDTIQDFLQEHL